MLAGFGQRYVLLLIVVLFWLVVAVLLLGPLGALLLRLHRHDWHAAHLLLPRLALTLHPPSLLLVHEEVLLHRAHAPDVITDRFSRQYAIHHFLSLELPLLIK